MSYQDPKTSLTSNIVTKIGERQIDPTLYTSQQREAINSALDMLSNVLLSGNKRIFKIGGYAGTGKTTVLNAIIEGAREQLQMTAMPCSFTGKAALRMIMKGVEDASTIHSLIYKYDRETDTFYKRSKFDIPGDFFLIDEASMISKELWHDLLHYEKPIILVGDPGQLEPVGDDPQLMKKCDLVLTQIHRQAELSSIVSLATNVRHKKLIKFNDYDKQEVRFHRAASTSLLGEADIVLCGFNKTRIALNNKIRRLRAFNCSETLNAKETIIVLQNNRKKSVFNGELWTVDKIIGNRIDRNKQNIIDAECSNALKEQRVLSLVRDQFGNAKSLLKEIKQSFNYVFADYGYCITCHKSQGSEWDHVLVIDEQCKIWDANRWRYTAVTRAARQLDVVTNGFQ